MWFLHVAPSFSLQKLSLPACQGGGVSLWTDSCPPCPAPALHTPALFSDLSTSPIPKEGPGGHEKAKRQPTGRRSRAAPSGGGRCIPLTYALEKAGRPVCSTFQGRLDITHWGGIQKPWSPPPTHFWQIAPAVNSGLTPVPRPYLSA